MKDITINLSYKERTLLSSALVQFHIDTWKRIDMDYEKKKELRKRIEDIRNRILKNID